MTLRTKTLALSLVSFLIPVMIISLISDRKMGELFMSQSVTAAVNATEKSAQQFDLYCATMAKNLSNTANSTNLKNYRSVRMNSPGDSMLLMNYTRLFNGELTSFMSYSSDVIRSLLLLWDDMGTPIIKGSPSFPYASDYRDHELYQAALGNVLNPLWRYAETESGQPYITIATAVMDGYQVGTAGVLIMELRSQILDNYFSAASSEHGERTLVLDQQHRVLYDSDDLISAEILDWPWLADLRERPNGFQARIGEQGFLVTYQEAPVTGWTVVSLLPASYIDDALRPQRQITMLMILLACCAAVLIASMSYSMFYRPIQGLMRVMTRFGSGHLNARITVRKRDEIATLFHNFNGMAARIMDLVQQVETYQQKHKDVEILFLQAQVIPHFLSNALGSIGAMAQLGRNDEIVQMSASLEQLLRIVSTREVMIPLADELCYVLEYLNIMKLRYQMHIDVECGVDDEAMSVLLPKFTLQPIVENCIVHAFDDQSVDPRIAIRCAVQGPNLVVSISDNGRGTDQWPSMDGEDDDRADQSAHIGLRNIHERLQLLFDAPDCGLRFRSAPGQGTTLDVTIPVYTSPG